MRPFHRLLPGKSGLGFRRRERDSNPRVFRPTVFKTAAFGRSAIPPLAVPANLAAPVTTGTFLLYHYHAARVRSGRWVPVHWPEARQVQSERRLRVGKESWPHRCLLVPVLDIFAALRV